MVDRHTVSEAVTALTGNSCTTTNSVQCMLPQTSAVLMCATRAYIHLPPTGPTKQLLQGHAPQPSPAWKFRSSEAQRVQCGSVCKAEGRAHVPHWQYLQTHSLNPDKKVWPTLPKLSAPPRPAPPRPCAAQQLARGWCCCRLLSRLAVLVVLRVLALQGGAAAVLGSGKSSRLGKGMRRGSALPASAGNNIRRPRQDRQ